MNLKKALSLMSLLLVFAIVLSSCGSKAGKNGTSSVGTNEGGEPANKTLVVALKAEPTSLDPQVASERITWVPVKQLYDTLVYENEAGELEPAIAESWEVSPEGDSIVFKIREGVKFHNGETMTVEDVSYSINRTIEEYPSKLFSSAMKNMEIVDESHVKLNLLYPFAPALYCVNHISFGITPKAAVEADKESFGRNPIGSGPFKFVEWVSGDHVNLERFDEYWRGPAKIENITFKTITDTNSSVLALEKGEIDVVLTAPESYRSHLESLDNLSYYQVEGASIYILIFNNEEGIFKDKNLRLAVSHAINREEIIEGALEGNANPIYAPMAAFAFGYPDMNTFQPLEYDLEKSKEYLKAAGMPDGFKVVLKSTEAPNHTKPAEIIQAQLAKVGIIVEIEQMERGTYLQEVYKDCHYEMSIWSMTSDYPDGDSPTYARLHGSMRGNTNNYVLVDIPELNTALDIGRQSMDENEREKAYLTVSEIVRDEVPMIPLYAPMNNVVANKNLSGVRAHYGQVVEIYDYAWVN